MGSTRSESSRKEEVVGHVVSACRRNSLVEALEVEEEESATYKTMTFEFTTDWEAQMQSAFQSFTVENGIGDRCSIVIYDKDNVLLNLRPKLDDFPITVKF